MFRKKFKLIAMLLCMALFTSALTLSTPSTAEAATKDARLGALHVKGTHLVDKNGNIVQLKGVSTHGLSWYPGYVNDACFGELHDKWGANVVRLAMYTEEYNGYCSGSEENKAQLRKLVLQGVEYAKKHNLYVIVDWHILSDGDPMQNVTEAKKFWKIMSKALSGYDNVLYEICNEPNGAGSWTQIKSYANQVIPIIRKYDSDSVIIVGTPTWSQELDKAVADPLNYKNIMYTLHFYAGTHKQSLRDVAKNAINSGLPIFVTEFGISDASGNGALDKTEGNRWISFLNKNKVSYVAWNLSNKDESSSLIASSCSKLSGFKKTDLSASGKWFYNVLHRNAKKKAVIKVKTASFTIYRRTLSKNRALNPYITVNSKGKLTFEKLAGSKYLSINKYGKVVVKAKTPKGYYRILIRIKAAATKTYKSATRRRVIAVRIK